MKQFLCILLLAIGFHPGAGFAADPVVFTGDGIAETTPQAHCWAMGGFADSVTYGNPTTYRCIDRATSSVIGAYRTQPECPAGSEPDYSRMLCVPKSEEFSLDLKMISYMFMLFTLAMSGMAGYSAGRRI